MNKAMAFGYLVFYMGVLWLIGALIIYLYDNDVSVVPGATAVMCIGFVVTGLTSWWIERKKQISVGSLAFGMDKEEKVRLWVVTEVQHASDGIYYLLVVADWLLGKSEYIEIVLKHHMITPVGKFEKYFMAMLKGKRHDH